MTDNLFSSESRRDWTNNFGSGFWRKCIHIYSRYHCSGGFRGGRNRRLPPPPPKIGSYICVFYPILYQNALKWGSDSTREHKKNPEFLGPLSGPWTPAVRGFGLHSWCGCLTHNLLCPPPQKKKKKILDPPLHCVPSRRILMCAPGRKTDEVDVLLVPGKRAWMINLPLCKNPITIVICE